LKDEVEAANEAIRVRTYNLSLIPEPHHLLINAIIYLHRRRNSM